MNEFQIIENKISKICSLVSFGFGEAGTQIISQVLKEGLNVYITFFEGEMLGIDLPEKIDYKIVNTEPAVKGNTATNATKDAILETGLLVRVPLFIDEGEEIIVSTKDGKYVSRK